MDVGYLSEKRFFEIFNPRKAVAVNWQTSGGDIK